MGDEQFFDKVVDGQLFWHISKLHEWEKNKLARTITDTNFRRLKDSISIHGIDDTFKILPDGTVLDGNNRLRALLDLMDGGVAKSSSGKELAWVPVIVVDAKTEADKWRYALERNGHYASWDPDGLNNFLPEFEEELDLTLFNIEFREPKSIDQTLTEMEKAAEQVETEKKEAKEATEVNPNVTETKVAKCPNCGHEFDV